MARSVVINRSLLGIFVTSLDMAAGCLATVSALDEEIRRLRDVRPFTRGPRAGECSPSRSINGAGQPILQAIEIEIEDRRSEKRQKLHHCKPAANRITKWLTKFRAPAYPKHQRHAAEHGGHSGHEDRAKAQQARLGDGAFRRQSLALARDREIDQHDAVLLDYADQQN